DLVGHFGIKIERHRLLLSETMRLWVVEQPQSPDFTSMAEKRSGRAQRSRWNCSEGGDPLGRDLDGEHGRVESHPTEKKAESIVRAAVLMNSENGLRRLGMHSLRAATKKRTGARSPGSSRIAD